MMADQADGPPNKRQKIGGPGVVNPNDNNAYNFRALEDLPDGLLGGNVGNMAPNSTMMSHQPPPQPPIHETHSNLTALLSNNTPAKDVNLPSSMNNTMINSYSGPGPGQYHNNMMANGLSSANYNSTGYNSAVSFSGSSNMMVGQPALSSSSYSVSNTMPHTLSALSNQQPNMNSMQNQQQQLSGMVPQNQQPSMQHQPGMAMMNGPSSAMPNMNTRPLPGNNMAPRLPNPQSMNNGAMNHPGNGSMGVPPGAQGQQMMGSAPMPGPRPAGMTQPNGGPGAINAKRKQLQQQLVLLLHAHKCQRREQSNGEVDRACTLMYCKTMKGVLQHMTVCTEGKQCQVAHCVSSRQIIEHWRSCNRGDCPVCLPLKSASDKKNSGQANMLNSLVQSTQPGGANALNLNGLDLPGAGPGLGMSAQGPAPSMPGATGTGNMPPPNWPQHSPHQPMGDPMGLPRPTGLMTTTQPRAPLPNPPNMPSGAVGSQPQPVITGGGSSQPSAPEMKKAYDALGLTYPGAGVQHGTMPQQPGQRSSGQLGVGCLSSKDQPTKEWHKNVAIDLRNHLVHKLVQAIFPSPQPEILNDPRMTNLIHYARKVEMEMYLTASSRENYYHMLAEKIYKIQKELEQKRETRRQQMKNMQQSQHGVGMQQHSGPQQAGGADLSQLNTMVPLSNASSLGANVNGPSSVQSNPAGGPGSVPSYSGPPSAGPHSIASASMMSPPVGGANTGIPVSMALQESKNELHEALRKQQLQHGGNEFKTEIKAEPDSTMDSMSTNEPVKAEVKPEPTIKEEPRSNPVTPKPEVKDVKDIKPVTPSNQPKQPAERKVFTAEELRHAFQPLVEKLLQTEESMPFRQPVDAQALNIPDYYDIIRNPMDLQSIQSKLDTGAYEDPWHFCDDIWLMFDNCWAYNRKTSRVYKCGLKLAEMFELAADVEMQKLGFCCGRKYVFHPQTLCCYGKQLCTINRDQVYYSYENRYVYCEKCFDEIHSDMVDLSDEVTGNPVQLPKSSFMKTKNDHLEMEKFSMCTDCGRKLHNICVQHMDSIWPQGFTCENCLKAKGAKRKDNRFTGKRLPSCKLSAYLESRVNNYLKKKDIGAGEVVIRVLASGDKETEVKQGLRDRFPNLPASYPYRTKAMFAFEEIDGQEVCFFGMHVQEYDDRCCQPNRGRVYISYLDSVHFFQPREYRTAVYHEILIGYLDYSKSLGFNWGHIWACPPSEGDDYIFHCHPTEQKIPKPKRLQDWYKKMLDKAIIEGVVIEYKDIYKDAVEKSLQCASDVPYFEGDFWPNVLEESIRELEQEEEEKRKRDQEIAAAQDDEAEFVPEDESSMDASNGAGKKQGKKGGQKKKGNKKAGTRKSIKKPAQQSGSDLSSKVLSAMEKYRDVFFVIKLQPHALARQDVVTDPDPLIACDLMDGRDAFLTMAREKHWEFSTLRRTKYSTMAMLHEIHTSSRDSFVYTCNLCQGQVETRYHCTVCDDFDLCVPCYQKEKHQHPMERLGLDLDGDGNSDGSGGSQTPAESRKISIQRCIQQLVHACQCRDANCRQASCQKMKKVVSHTRSCKKKSHGGCSICKQLVTLCCFHAKSCNEGKCPVPFCPNIRQKLKQQQQAARKKQAHMLRRRMKAMITPSQTSASSTPPSAPSGGSSKLQHSSSQSSLSQVPSPYTGGKSMQSAAPAAALSAAQHALDAAMKQSHGPSMPGGKSMNQMQSAQQPQHMQASMGKPQRALNPGHMMHQQQNQQQGMSPGMQPNGAQMAQSYQQMGQRDNHQGMSQSHVMMQQPMQTHDQWGNQQQPPPMYPSATGQPRPQHMPGTHPGVMGPMPPVHQQQMNPNASTHTPNMAVLKKLEMALKSPSSPQQHQDLMELLKRNPSLMDAFIKRKSQSSQVPHPQHSLQQGSHMPGQMPPQRMQEMWQHRRAPMQQPNMYQQPQNPNYQQQQQPPIGARGPMMPPGGMPSQYGMGQPRYHGPDGSGGMAQPVMSGHQQQVMRATGPHNQLLHQVRSPTSLQQHTRSPQPIQSPRQHASASPALMQSDNTAAGMGMMQSVNPSAQHNFTPMNTGNMHPDYGDQQAAYGGQPGQMAQPGQDNGALTPQEELTKFVESL